MRNNNTDKNERINKSEIIGATKIIKDEQKQVVKIIRELPNDVQRAGGIKTVCF